MRYSVGCAAAIALAVLALTCEGVSYGDVGQAANLDAPEEGPPSASTQKSPPIKYHTVAGLHRIDLDDEEADDATYRAFQLARYTGDAAMQVKHHEEEFMRERAEQMMRARAELGEHNDQDEHDDEEENQEHERQQEHDENRAAHEQSEDSEHPRKRKHLSGAARIMGAGDSELLETGEGSEVGELNDADGSHRIMGAEDDDEHDLGESSSPVSDHGNLGESTTAQAEALASVHVPRSGDIEDDDFHFVMTDKLRHAELKKAVLHASEKPEEAKTTKLAHKMEHEQQKIGVFETKQELKDSRDEHHMSLESEVSAALQRHHLQLDKKGRVVPDF